MAEAYWAVAQTVTKMEHLVRRDIEKTNHGAFLPTCARFGIVDGRRVETERPMIGGYVFFLTSGDDYAGIPDILGVYRVLTDAHNGNAIRVPALDMRRLVLSHATGEGNETMHPRYTKYYNPMRAFRTPRKTSRKPRASKRARSGTHA
jgi:hypothetical protein